MLNLKQKGTSIIEVLAAIPIGLVVVFTLSTAMRGFVTDIQSFKSKNESTITQNVLRDVMATSKVCSDHLRANTRTYDMGLAQDGKLNLSFSLDDGGSVLETGSDLPKYNIHINSLIYQLLPDGANYMDDPLLPGNNLQYGTVVVETSKISTGPMIRNAPQTVSGLVLSVDSQNKISRCFLIDDSYNLCAAVGGHLYNDGTRDYCYAANPCGDKLMTGFDASGNPICVDIKGLVGQRCPSNQFLVSDGNGNSACTPLPGSTPQTAGNNPGTPPPPSSPCDAPGSIPSAAHGAISTVPPTALSGSGETGAIGCFYTDYGPIAIATIDPKTNRLIFSPGPAADPAFPFSSFTMTTSGGSTTISHPTGASMRYP
jgi:hypothetical protein